MKKKYIIKPSRDISLVITKGCCEKSNSFIIYYISTEKIKSKKLNNTKKENIIYDTFGYTNKVAFLVNKKIGNSPQRNYAKRKLKNALNLYWKDLEQGYHIIFLLRAYISSCSYSDLNIELKKKLYKIKILKKENKN